ncbi:hypothetical protein Tco_0023958 [Tanacetum coccineum]
MSKFNEISQISKVVSSILGIVDQHLASKMKEAVDVAVRLQSNKLKEDAEVENKEFHNQVDSTMKAIIKEQDQGNESGHLDDKPDNEADPKHDWFWLTDKPPTPDRAWNKSKSIDSRPPQKWISTIAKARQPPRTFDELMDTTIDFSAYVMNRLKIDNLTQEILVGPTFNLLKGTCKSFIKLEYHFEERYKAINDRLDWHNPEGREYPFDLS